jgi:uncharacterized membrane protein YccC
MPDTHRSKWLLPKFRRDVIGIRFALNVFIATNIVWYVLENIADTNPIWAIASMIAASEPQVTEAVRMFRSRIINVLTGCIVGLAFVTLGGATEWKLPLALAVTVLVSSYVIHIPTMWRQAPITAAFVISAGIEHHSRLKGLQAGVFRMSEVLFGCVVGLAVAWLVSVVWPLPEPQVK